MDLKKPHAVDLSRAIRIGNVRLNDVLAQHAERVGELDAEDSTPPTPSCIFVYARGIVPYVDDANGDGGAACNSSPLPRPVKKKKRPEKHSANRNAKRAQIRAINGHTLKACALNRVLGTVPVPVDMALETNTIPVTLTGWMGQTDRAIENAGARDAKSAEQEGDCDFEKSEIPTRRFLELNEALAEPGMRLITAEMQGPTTAIIDADDQVIVVLNCGPIGASDWKRTTEEASTAMDKAAQLLYGPDYDKEPLEQHGDCPRRGPHYAVHMGTGMGGGQQQPTPFTLHYSVTQILTALFFHDAIARFVGMANGLFQMYAPKLYRYYLDTMCELQKWDPNLPLLAPLLSCVFACVTFNFGPQTVTFPHLNFLNLAWGWCFITALGWYDYRKGGHLILWDLRLVIEFPPGSTFAIPSAVLRHSNVSIQQGEKRFSMTQYTSAGVFRFVNNGFRTDVTVKAKMSKAEQHEFAAAARVRYSKGLEMYSTLEELKMRAFM
ncbi:hypothetical protein MVEN_00008800 [Mycena venus]|uniref:Uncharacterized protein n=1 Tax=Mycena venus TaxID=2733690 RepID=A0A8H6Z2R2_9AGAR|nr:hypothetical protein MVEN_00008800 [Mycena venus]